MTQNTSLDWAHPLVRDWFTQKVGFPTEPQAQGWPHILAGRSTLISAPTGSKRMVNYQPDWLDRLCLSGTIGWGRLSPHPVIQSDTDPSENKKRIMPTSIAPITFFMREESDWMPIHQPTLNENPTGLSPVAESIYIVLKQKGACFFSDIVSSTQHLKSEIETGLWELVTAGLVTAWSLEISSKEKKIFHAGEIY